MTGLTPFDPADYLDGPAEAAAYLALVVADGDFREIVDALNVAARILEKPEPKLPADAGFEALAEALKGMGLRLAVQPLIASAEAEAA